MHGIILSTEVGKRFWLESEQQGFYLEPQTQLSYGYQIQGKNPINVYVKTGVVREISGGTPLTASTTEKKTTTPSAQAGLIMALVLT